VRVRKNNNNESRFLQYYIYRVAEEERGENELASMYFHSLLGKRFNSRNQ